jgi:hypothetical protein
MGTLTVDELRARWADLPLITYGRHEAGRGEYSLLEKVANVLGREYSYDDSALSPLVAMLGGKLNNWFTGSGFAGMLDQQTRRLDALGPRIALCVPNLELELGYLPLLVQVALHTASGWLEATGNAGLIEQAKTLRAQAEKPDDFAGVETAADAACRAAADAAAEAAIAASREVAAAAAAHYAAKAARYAAYVAYAYDMTTAAALDDDMITAAALAIDAAALSTVPSLKAMTGSSARWSMLTDRSWSTSRSSSAGRQSRRRSETTL